MPKVIIFPVHPLISRGRDGGDFLDRFSQSITFANFMYKLHENMKRQLLIFCLIALTASLSLVQAQSLKSVIRKTVVEPSRAAHGVAEDMAQQRAEEEATKAIMAGFGIEEDAKFDPEYKFDAWFQMKITNYNKNGKVDDEVVYNNYINKHSFDYGMVYMDDDATATILYDSSRFAMIILSEDDGDKTGFATKLDPDALGEAIDEELEASDYHPMKTGKTRDILGYKCEEYLVEEDGSEVHMWVSEKLGKEVRKELLSNPNAFGGAFTHSLAVNGMTLEYEVINTKNGEKTLMQVTDLDLDKKTSISTAGYSIISMNLGE